jgi:acetyl-CoA carboxylase biotin carboxyl carrier protein
MVRASVAARGRAFVRIAVGATADAAGRNRRPLLPCFPTLCNDRHDTRAAAPSGLQTLEPGETKVEPIVAKDELTYEDLLKIVELVKSSPHFSEFRLKVGEIELHLKRKRDASSPGPSPASIEPALPDPVDAATDVARDEARPSWPEHWVVVRSPMVGTFYRAPSPGAPPFVKIGQPVQPDATVCIIEVMKLMNSIAAGSRGVVREILVGDAQAVEYGQALVVLEPQ